MAGVMVKLSKLSSLEGPNPTEVSGEKEEDVLPCDNLVSSGIMPLEGLGVSLSLRNISMGHWGPLYCSTQCGCPSYRAVRRGPAHPDLLSLFPPAL